MLCQPGQAQSRSTQPGLKLSHMAPLYSGYNTLTFSPFCYHTWCWRVLSYTPNLLSILPRMEPDNTVRYQPDLSLLPALQPVAQPSPIESAWTIPTLSSSPDSTPSLEAELTERLEKMDEIAALLEDSDNEEGEKLENERLRMRRLVEEVQAANPQKGKGHGLGKGSRKRNHENQDWEKQDWEKQQDCWSGLLLMASNTLLYYTYIDYCLFNAWFTL